MPQSTNYHNLDCPFGRGSLHNQLAEYTLKNRRRVAKIGESDRSRKNLIIKVLDKHHQYQDMRNEKFIKRTKQSLVEMDAYQKLLQTSYKSSNFLSLKFGFKARDIKTARSSEHYKQEHRIYYNGYSKKLLKGEINRIIDKNDPTIQKREAYAHMLAASQRRSNFTIDRRVTNEAVNREKVEKMLQLEKEKKRFKEARQKSSESINGAVDDYGEEGDLEEEKPPEVEYASWQSYF